MAKVYIGLLLLLSGSAFSQVNCIQWKNSAGGAVGNYCKPFNIKAGSGIAFQDDPLHKTMTIGATATVAGAGGSDTQINFNSSGSLAGSPGLTWNYSTNTLAATHITGLDNRPYIDMKRDCGLVGDGATDDALAANICLAQYPGWTFYFPPTNSLNNPSYYFASSLAPTGNGTTILGSGATFLNDISHLGGDVLKFAAGITGVNWDSCGGCTVARIGLLGSETTQQLQNPSLLNFPSATNLPLTQRSLASIQRTSNVITGSVTRVVGIEGLTQQVGSTIKLSGIVGDATLNGLCDILTLTGNTAFGGNPNGFTCAQNGADSGPFVSDGILTPPTTGASTADGIRVCNNFNTIDSVIIQGFGRHAINADSNAGHGCTSAFSDSLKIRDSFLNSNQGNGILCAGVDCNANVYDGNQIYYNVMWGIEDQSSLGNTHTGNQISNNSHLWASSTTPATKNITSVNRTSGTVAVVLASANPFIKLGTCVFTAGVTDASFNTTAGQCFFVTSFTDSTHFSYIQPGNPSNASSSGGTNRIAKFAEAYLSSGLDDGAQKIATQSAVANPVITNQYVEGGQYCKLGSTSLLLGGTGTPGCVATGGGDWVGQFITTQGCSGLGGILCLSNPALVNAKDATGETYLRAGLTTEYGYGFTWLNHSSLRSWGLLGSPTGTLGGTGKIELTSQGYGQTRFVFFGKDATGNSYINGEGTGGVYFNRNSVGTNAGTGGVHFYSGGSGSAEVASISSTGLVTPGTTVVASLPSAASNPGAMIRVSDSTSVSAEGQTCVGSSSNNALAFSNGSVWKCF